MQPKLPLERSEYHILIGIALELGKSLETARKDWREVNNPLGTEYHRLHQRWRCCNYDD